MLIETVAASGAVLLCRKGRFASLKRLHIHGWYLLITSVLLQTLLSLDVIPATFHYATIFISYILVILCLMLNLRRLSMKLALAGVSLNFIVIAANQGYMPVWLEGLKYAGYDVSTITSNILDTFHSLITESTRVSFLADIIPIPEPYPFPQMLSIGDFFIMAGVFMFFQDLKPRSRPWKKSESQKLEDESNSTTESPDPDENPTTTAKDAPSGKENVPFDPNEASAEQLKDRATVPYEIKRNDQ